MTGVRHGVAEAAGLWLGSVRPPGAGRSDGRFLSLWLNKPKRVGSGWARRHVRGH